MLLGLPFSDSALSTVALSGPSGRHRYGQSPLAAAEESDESFGETAPDEGVIEETRGAVADSTERLARSLVYETDTPRDFVRAPRHDGASFSRAIRENSADARSTLTEPSAEHREQTRLVIPGVSIHRTAFPTLSQTVDTQTNSVKEELRDAIPPQAAPLNAPVSLPRAREMITSNGELLTRLEQLVTEGVETQKSSEARTRLSAPRSPGLPERIGMESGERRGQELVYRFEQLQRTVRDLAATVSQTARNRDESQAQRSEPKTLPRQRAVIIQRSDRLSTAPRAFWERSRLGRFYLRTGR